MKGLILAAGKGKRLMPLTKSTPKALIPIGGRPLIAYPLLKLKNAGIRNIGIVISPQDYTKFKSALKFPGLKLSYIFQSRPKGTAEETRRASSFLKGKRFLICWCDFLSPFDLRRLVKDHLRFKPAATILINKAKDPSGTGQVLFKDHCITRIAEKPLKRFSVWGSTGALVFEPEIFSALPKIKPSADGEYHIADALQYLIDKGKRVRFIKLDTWAINVNTLKDLNKAREKASTLLRSITC